MDVVIKVFQASDSDTIDAAQGEFEGNGYTVTRLHADKGMTCVDETGDSPDTHSFGDVVVLCAKAGTDPDS